MSIELNECVGIGTDDCTVMTSTMHGEISIFHIRLNTWLRPQMGQDRLVGLALLNVHREYNISV